MCRPCRGDEADRRRHQGIPEQGPKGRDRAASIFGVHPAARSCGPRRPRVELVSVVRRAGCGLAVIITRPRRTGCRDSANASTRAWGTGGPAGRATGDAAPVQHAPASSGEPGAERCGRPSRHTPRRWAAAGAGARGSKWASPAVAGADHGAVHPVKARPLAAAKAFRCRKLGAAPANPVGPAPRPPGPAVAFSWPYNCRPVEDSRKLGNGSAALGFRRRIQARADANRSSRDRASGGTRPRWDAPPGTPRPPGSRAIAGRGAAFPAIGKGPSGPGHSGDRPLRTGQSGLGFAKGVMWYRGSTLRQQGWTHTARGGLPRDGDHSGA